MQTDFYAPLLRGMGAVMDAQWSTLLAHDYHRPKFHVSYLLALAGVRGLSFPSVDDPSAASMRRQGLAATLRT